MKTNLGSYDVAARFCLGCISLAVGAHYSSWWGLMGLVPLTTSMMGFCPLYVPFHWDTTWTDRPSAGGPS